MQRNNAFTLIELLVALSVVAALVLLVGMAANKVVNAGRTAKCMANLRAMGPAVTGYAYDNNGYFPPHYGRSYFETSSQERIRKQKWWWMAHLGIYLGAPSSLAGPMSPIFNCPNDPNVKDWPVNRPYIPADADDKSHRFCSYGYNYNFLSTSPGWYPKGEVDAEGNINEKYPTNIKAITKPGKLFVITEGRLTTTDPIVNPFSETAGPSFRHANRFNALFLDGHVEAMPPKAAQNQKPNWWPE